jgi:hypothetical protein
MSNKIFVLHLDGKIITPNIWKKFSNNYGNNSLYGWRPSKKMYMTLGHAKAAISHLPEQIRDKVEIVEYTPK